MKEPTDDLITMLERATHAAGVALEARIRDAGISQAEAHVLRFLTPRRQAAISDIHRSFGHRRSTLTSVIDRLEQRGLIRRLPHPTSRRSVLIQLTPRGIRLGREVVRVVEGIEHEIRGQVRPAAQHGFQAVIAALTQVLAPARAGEGRKHAGRRPVGQRRKP